MIDACALFCVALGLLLVLGGALARQSGWPPPVAVIATELLAILVPALLWTRARQPQLLVRLGLGVDRRLPRALLGGALLGAAWFFLSVTVVEPLSVRLIPVSPSEQEALLRMLVPKEGLRPLALDLLGYALAPALCEELLFRGALFTLLEAALKGRGRALVLTALLFGLYHLTPAKILPTAFLGLGFGLPRLRSDSLWPSIAMHLCNNTLVILLVRHGFADPPWPHL